MKQYHLQQARVNSHKAAHQAYMSDSAVCLVTGGGTGIGAAACEALAASGYAAAIHFHRSAGDAAALAERLRVAGGKARTFQADLIEPGGAQRMVDAVMDAFGRIDVLVNNAGSLVGRRGLLEITDEFWQEVMETNLASVMRVTRAVVPHMMRQGSGSIINVASVAARNGGSAGVVAYAAAKAGVVGMTKALARELILHNIRVNAVNPGVIDTPLHDRFTSSERMQALIAAIPQRRAGTAAEVGAVIAFLAGSGASYLVGETIEVNGGLWMD